MTRSKNIKPTAILPSPDGGFFPCPGVTTEEELIRFLRIPEISNASDYRHVVENLKQLKRVFQQAEDRSQLDLHPLRKLKPPKVARRKIRVFTDHECHSLCRMAQQYEEKGSPIKSELLNRIGSVIGMRRGELMNATRRDIEFANMTIDVSPKKDSVDTWEWHIKDRVLEHEVQEVCAGRERTTRTFPGPIKRKNLLFFAYRGIVGKSFDRNVSTWSQNGVKIVGTCRGQ